MTKGSTARSRRRGLGHDRPRQATIRPREATTQPAACKGVRQRARCLAGGVCHDTKFCIVIGERDWPLGVVSR